MAHCQHHGFRLRLTIGPIPALLCVLMNGLFSLPLFSQMQKIGGETPVILIPTMPDNRVVFDRGGSQPGAGENKMCSIQPFPGMPGTASVTTLQIPRKAQKEYEAACAALKINKMPETERHLRRATEIYPKYVAGWVMLGQTLESTRQTAAARSACSRASTAEPNYLPAYLCLAEIAGREQEWNEVLNLTKRALELDPVNDAYAYFFRAIAYFNLNQLPAAQEGALKAEAIDKDHHEPLVQYLLAQIYAAEHDSTAAAAHLREYQKLAPHSQDSGRIKQDLREARHRN
jgi:cytochrome c-type biogenesis protein CcmH/NrfG